MCKCFVHRKATQFARPWLGWLISAFILRYFCTSSLGANLRGQLRVCQWLKIDPCNPSSRRKLCSLCKKNYLTVHAERDILKTPSKKLAEHARELGKVRKSKGDAKAAMQDQDEGQSVIYEDEKKLLQRRSSSRVGITPPPPRPILHILSGAGAGAAAAIATCPLDVIKTRMQSQDFHSPTAYKSTSDAMRRIYNAEGTRGFFRGLGPNLFALLPTWSVYFTAYEFQKKFLRRNLGLKKDSSRLHLLAAICAGATSTLATSPLWLIKTRLMTQQRGVTDHFYKNSIDAVFTIFRTEGVRGLYKGLTASLFGVVHVGIQFPLYERLKIAFRSEDPQEQLPTWAIMAASAISKIVASIAWYPHEVVRTRLQLQSTGVARYSGVFNCVSIIWREEGPRAFYRGLGTNLMRVAPACAITFASYESLLNFLEKLDNKYNPATQIRGTA